MILTLPPQLEAALADEARRRGIAAEELAVEILRRRLVPLTPIDDWERQLFALGTDCGVAVPDAALSSDGLYE